MGRTKGAFGQSSERGKLLVEQLELAIEDLEETQGEEEAKAEIAAPAAAKEKRKRPPRGPRKLPDNLPVERVVEPAPCACGKCGGLRLRKLSEVVSKTVECEPRRWKIIENVREKFACRDCDGVTEPPAPSHPIPRGFAGPSLLAMSRQMRSICLDPGRQVPRLVTGQGCATPLIWLSVDKDELKNRRNDFEDACLTRLNTCLPEGVAVTILADRGFGDVKPFAFLQSLGFDFAIRLRGDIQVIAQTGETRTAAQWLGAGGRARMLRDVELTAARRSAPAVVSVHANGIKEPWCIAASHRDGSAREIINRCAKRWSIEPGFRDEKDLRFGLGLSALRIADPQRCDRLLLLSALTIVPLTLLGAAGESPGLDRLLKSNTSKRRTHSLFRRGCLLYDLIPNMPETRLRPIVEKYTELLKQHSLFTQTFGLV